MIDFVNLVEHLLEDCYFLLESRDVTVFQYHFDDKRYNTVKQEFDKKYSGLALPSRDSFKPTLLTILGRSRSPMINPEKVPGVEVWFPIFDLLCLLDTIVAGLSSPDDIDPVSTETQFQQWITRFKADTSSVPLEYNAMESTAVLLQKKLRAATDLGDLRIDSLNKAFSFYSATEELLEIRRNIKKQNKTWIGAKMDAVFDAAGVQKIQKILFEPLTIISGTQEISKDLEAVFDFGIIQNLTKLSTSFYLLYKTEITTAVDFFIQNTTLQMRVGGRAFLAGADIVAYLNTRIRAKLLDILYKDMELYRKYLGDPVADIAKQLNFYYIIYSNIKKLEPALIGGTQKPGLPMTLKFAVGDTTNPFQCVYSLEKLILNNKGGYKEAQDVYKILEDFADYIAKKENNSDVAGGATTILKGLSLGVKNMGD